MSELKAGDKVRIKRQADLPAAYTYAAPSYEGLSGTVVRCVDPFGKSLLIRFESGREIVSPAWNIQLTSEGSDA